MKKRNEVIKFEIKKIEKTNIERKLRRNARQSATCFFIKQPFFNQGKYVISQNGKIKYQHELSLFSSPNYSKSNLTSLVALTL